MQDLNVLLEPVRSVLQQIGVFLPRLLVALGVLIAGWLLAKGARFAVVKGLRCRERQRAEKSNDKAKSAKIHAPYCSQPIAATVSPWPGGSARGRDMKPIFA